MMQPAMLIVCSSGRLAWFRSLYLGRKFADVVTRPGQVCGRLYDEIQLHTPITEGELEAYKGRLKGPGAIIVDCTERLVYEHP